MDNTVLITVVLHPLKVTHLFGTLYYFCPKVSRIEHIVLQLLAYMVPCTAHYVFNIIVHHDAMYHDNIIDKTHMIVSNKNCALHIFL